MELLWLIFILCFSIGFGAQVPVCTAANFSGVLYDDNLNTVQYTYSFDLNVAYNADDITYQNTLSVSNFANWSLDTSLYRQNGPLMFEYEGLIYFLECPWDANSCVIGFPNTATKPAFFFIYENGSYILDDPLSVFINNGKIFDGNGGAFFDNRNNPCISNHHLFYPNLIPNARYNETSCCTHFDYVTIPDSNQDVCQSFESKVNITDSSRNTTIFLDIQYLLVSDGLNITVTKFETPDSSFLYDLYINNEITQCQTQLSRNNCLINFPENDFQFEITSYAFVWNTVSYNGIIGEIIKRNGILLKNDTFPYTRQDPCWSKVATDINSNGIYDSLFCCTHFADDIPTTMETKTTPSLPPSDPQSDGVGTLCSNDTTQAWLDVVFVVDTSNVMSTDDLKGISSEIATTMQGFNIGQNGNHTTRAAIISYSTIVTTIYKLTDNTDYNAFADAIFTLSDYFNPDDDGGSIKDALNQAFDMLQDQGGIRRKIIVLYTDVYNAKDVEGADTVANKIKADGIVISVINFATENSPLTNALQSISSPGYYYLSNTTDFIHVVSYAFTQINCICKKDWTQFGMYNPTWKNYTNYADCFYAHEVDSSPANANRACHPGTLVALTSSEKLHFITDNIIPYFLNKKKYFTIGLHRDSDASWKWWGYNQTEYPYNHYPIMAQSSPPEDNYGYIWNHYGFNWSLQTGPDFQFSYICQEKACDATNFCKS